MSDSQRTQKHVVLFSRDILQCYVSINKAAHLHILTLSIWPLSWIQSLRKGKLIQQFLSMQQVEGNLGISYPVSSASILQLEDF